MNIQYVHVEPEKIGWVRLSRLSFRTACGGVFQFPEGVVQRVHIPENHRPFK